MGRFFRGRFFSGLGGQPGCHAHTAVSCKAFTESLAPKVQQLLSRSTNDKFWLQVRDLHPKPEPCGPQVRDPGPGPGRSRSGPLWFLAIAPEDLY